MKDYKIKINGNEYAIEIKDVEDNTANVVVNGVEYNLEVEGLIVKNRAKSTIQKQSASAAAPVAVSAPRPASGVADGIKSPLPGVILDVMVREGDTVSVGQKLMVLEAMKMENNIESDRSGVVSNIVKRKGDSVLEGDILITIS